MALAIIGGMPERFAPFAEIHRRAAAEAGFEPPPLGINSHGFIADTSQRAAEESFGPVATAMDRIGRERGWPPMSRQDFDRARTLRGANFVGSPQEVIDKIMFQYRIFGHQRTLLQFTVGPMPHASVMRSIELFGSEVAPVIRKETASRASAGDPVD
jgi:alkanesulfonate monooxygenase SsuD/methylene tetrahydromethanopterin reductase-like flavin-dependent oxidoreductase (luciferase family)